MTTAPSPFTSLGLITHLARAAHDRGYAEPTAIQVAAIPPALQGRDIQACAHTGSGKTAAFALPLLQHVQATPYLLPRKSHALVLVPTRELAAQVGDTLRALAQHLPTPLKVATLFGGVSLNPQMMALRGGAEVVVATPGRLLDLVAHNALHLNAVSLLVLDEADRLLAVGSAGFADELARVLVLLPARRQNLLFSATFPPAVQALVQALLHEPVRIDVAPLTAQEQQPAITQRAIHVDAAQRTPLLRHLIEHEEQWTRVLVFVATRYASEHVAGKLAAKGIAAAALHGELSQGARTQVLADFKAGRLQVLVATDVAARGIDIRPLPVVLNYDLPRSAVDHLHRIGRTGRAGASGLAVSFISTDVPGQEAHFRLIEKRQGQRVMREQVAGFEPLETVASAVVEGGVKGKRKSKKDRLREAAGRGGRS